MGPSIPFVGIFAQSVDPPRPDDFFGAPVAEIFGKCAVGEPPPGSTRFNPMMFLRAIGKVIGWRFGGKTWPHPFFARDTRAPIYPLTDDFAGAARGAPRLLRPASDGPGGILTKPQRPVFSFSAACGAK
jgi:hypothetical protein